MAKIKVAEASGRVLNWAVAKCLGYTEFEFWHTGAVTTRQENGLVITHAYSDDWNQGGPIIDREKVDFEWEPNGKPVVMARLWSKQRRYRAYGPTPLIAAMRCYVASRVGDEVEVPDELLENPS